MPSNNTVQPEERARQQQALDLKLLGHSYEYIARALEYSDRSGAHRAVTAVLDRRDNELAEQHRQIESDRLDKALFKVWDNLKQAEEDANHAAIARYIELVVRICERRARLLGLDAPLHVRNEGLRVDLNAVAEEILAAAEAQAEAQVAAGRLALS